jgi:hypothetical protein
MAEDGERQIAIAHRGLGKTEEAIQSTLDFVRSGDARTIDWYSSNDETSCDLFARFLEAAREQDMKPEIKRGSNRIVRFTDGTLVRFIASRSRAQRNSKK